MWLIILSISVIAVSLLFLPVYTLISSQVEAITASVENASQKVNEYNLSSSALTKAGHQAQLLFQLENEKKITDLLSILTKLQNNNLTIREYDFKRTGKIIDSVKMAGEAKTRQTLVDFSDSLSGLEMVEKVDLPVSNLAKDKDLEFSLTIKLKENSL